jgi:hypothetical protein
VIAGLSESDTVKVLKGHIMMRPINSVSQVPASLSGLFCYHHEPRNPSRRQVPRSEDTYTLCPPRVASFSLQTHRHSGLLMAICAPYRDNVSSGVSCFHLIYRSHQYEKCLCSRGDFPNTSQTWRSGWVCNCRSYVAKLCGGLSR